MLLVTVSVLRVCLLVEATYFSYVVVVVVGRFSHTHLPTSVPLFCSKVTTNSWERSCDWMAG